MTGDSDNEVGNAGGSPVPTEKPHLDGGNLYRPLRGWASAYEPPPPSIFSRLGAGIARLFSRKKSDASETSAEQTETPLDDHEAMAAEHLADDANELAPEPSMSDEPLDVEWQDAPQRQPAAELTPEPLLETPDPEAVEAHDEYHDSFDAAWHSAPSSSAASSDLPLIRPYELRGEPIDESPVVREYELHSAVEETDIAPEADAEDTGEFPAEPLEAEPDVEALPTESVGADVHLPPVKQPRPGFWARLFGRGKKSEPSVDPIQAVEVTEASAEMATEQSPVAESSVDAIDDVAAESADSVEWIDLSAPQETVQAVEAVEADASNDVEPAQPVMDEIQSEWAPPPVRERLDRPSLEFFQRVESVNVEPEPADDVDALFTSSPTPPAPSDASLDEALPMDEGRYSELSEAVESRGEAPTEPWPPFIEAVSDVPAKKPGFFARLFGRKTKERPVEPEVVAGEPSVADTSDDTFAAAEEAFSSFERPEDQEPVTVDSAASDAFSSVDDALPADEPDSSSWMFEPPAPPAGFDKPFTTLEMDTPAVPMPGAVSDSRPTLEFEPGEFEVSSTADAPEVPDSRATAQVAAEPDESTDEFVPPTPPEVSAEAEAERPPFFVPKFRSFYNEIVTHKQQKAEFTGGFATAIVDYTADLSPDNSAQSLSKRLQEILELQAAEAMWMGGEAAQRYPDAQYAMAALADEMFMNMEWPGREAWPKFRLEHKLFKSSGADIEFFRRVDKLLKNEADRPTAAAKDLARLYLLVIASGFQGKYRPFNLTRPLAEYRRRLYEFVYGGDPLMIYADDRKIFPEATTRTVAGRAVSRFSLLQQWAAVLVILLIGYAVISQMAWNRVSAELKDVTARVESANSETTSDGTMEDR